MTRNPIGEALYFLILAAATVRDTYRATRDRVELWLGASRNPDDPDESDAEAASPVADYRSNA